MNHQFNSRNVAFVLPDSFSLGGVTTWSVQMGRRLPAAGLPTVLIEHSARYNRKLEVGPSVNTPIIDCTYLPHPNDLNFTVSDYLLQYKTVLPAVIIPNWSYGSFATCAALATDSAGEVRIIGVAHSDQWDYYYWLSYYETIIHKFIAVSQETALKLLALLPHRAEDISIRPYAVDIPDSLNRIYSNNSQPLQLVYAGRMDEWQKRISELVRLAQLLVEAGVNFKFRIIGDGEDKENLRQRIEQLDQTTRQHITLENGLPAAQMAEVWRSADIFILVSRYEGTSIAMLEAMAQGCVPVVTQVSGVTGVIQSGQNGFCVPGSDVMGMARIIKTLDNNREQLVKLGEKAYSTVAKKFGYQDYLHWFTGLIDEAWRQPPRPWPPHCSFLRPHSESSNRSHFFNYAMLPEDIIYNLNSEDIAKQIPLRKIVKAIGLKARIKLSRLITKGS